MSSHVLEVENLTKRFGDLVAVDGVSLHVDHGETYGLLGPNGAGKSTAISVIAGLLQPNGGAVRIGGEVMTTKATALRSRIGLVPQDLAVYPDLTCRENLRFFASLYGLDRAHARARIDEVLDVIGLTDRADDRADEFSGGMKRRLNIGIGLLHHPTLLILDEPTVGVDPQSRNSILASVEDLATDGISVLYTTHYMEEAERLCDRIGVIDRGRLVAEGTRRELVSRIGEQDVVRMKVVGDASAAAAACESVEGVGSSDAEGDEVVCLMDAAAGRLPALLAAVATSGASVAGVQVREPDLEDVFLHLTGNALRD